MWREKDSNFIKYNSFPYLKILPEEKYLKPKNNPPNVKIFFENGPNLKNINCFSNEEDKWRNSNINFISKNEIEILLDGKFVTERGRINCSLRENTGNGDGLVFNSLSQIFRLKGQSWRLIWIHQNSIIKICKLVLIDNFF